MLIDWRGRGRWHAVFCRSSWGSCCYTGVLRRGAGLGWSASEACREITCGGGGRGASAGGTGSGKSGAVNLAGLVWFTWIVRSNPSSS